MIKLDKVYEEIIKIEKERLDSEYEEGVESLKKLKGTKKALFPQPEENRKKASK